MTRVTKDSNGAEVRDGDIIHFAFGIPPVGVDARVVERNGRLIALTPEVTPKECELSKLRKYVGLFYKAEKRAPKPSEIEARMFAARRSAP